MFKKIKAFFSTRPEETKKDLCGCSLDGRELERHECGTHAYLPRKKPRKFVEGSPWRMPRRLPNDLLPDNPLVPPKITAFSRQLLEDAILDLRKRRKERKPPSYSSIDKLQVVLREVLGKSA